MKKALFFVAIVIPDPAAREIRSLQQYAATQFSSHAALRLPPHITLVPPFIAGENQTDQVVNALGLVAHVQARFNVDLQGFGYFGKKVIYINVTAEADLGAQASGLIDALQQSGLPVKTEERLYHPHITVAYKDLKPEFFDRAITYYRETGFARKFEVQGYTLLRKDGGGWKQFRDIAFP